MNRLAIALVLVAATAAAQEKKEVGGTNVKAGTGVGDATRLVPTADDPAPSDAQSPMSDAHEP